MTGAPITHLDLSGFHQVDELVWQDDVGIVLSLHYFDLRPDLPAPLHQVPQLQAGLARGVAAAGAGLVDCTVEVVDGLPAVCQLVKVRHPQGHGQGFVTTCIVPRATCSTMLKLQTAERGITGVRESVILERCGGVVSELLVPSPFAPDLTDGLPTHRADYPQYDAEFPDHPLTRSRQTMKRLLPTVRLDPGFKAKPPFA